MSKYGLDDVARIVCQARGEDGFHISYLEQLMVIGEMAKFFRQSGRDAMVRVLEKDVRKMMKKISEEDAYVANYWLTAWWEGKKNA